MNLGFKGVFGVLKGKKSFQGFSKIGKVDPQRWGIF